MSYPGLQLETFMRNYRRFHEQAPVVHQCPSATLELAARSFRFVHIDGSHLYENVAADLVLTKEAACRGAIIALDDYRKVAAPGVAAAVWTSVADGLTPIALTDGKMYAELGTERLHAR